MSDAQTALVVAPGAAPAKRWDAELTAKQIAFVEHWCRFRNATQAYTHAYDTNATYDTRAREGQRLLKDPRIAAAIEERQKAAVADTGADVAWLFNRFLAIATADPRELIGLKVGCCRYCHGEGFGYQWREREYLEALEKVEWEQREFPARAARFPDIAGGFGFNATQPPRPDCPQCHGEGVERFVPRDTDKLSDQAVLLYGGLKVKRDGYEIIIADRTKALELAGRIMGAFTDNVKLHGALAHMHAVADLRKVDPQEAAKIYRDFVAGNISAN
jgi:phage terminase small subunit